MIYDKLYKIVDNFAKLAEMEDLLDPFGYPVQNQESAALESSSPWQEGLDLSPMPEDDQKDQARLMPRITLYHADHGIKDAQLKFIVGKLMAEDDGFFIKEVKIPGQVPCGLYGPIMGDSPISDNEIEMVSRGRWEFGFRMIDKPMRPVDYVQAIGTKNGDELTIYTIYGGPLVSQNPNDPDNQNPEESKKFWSAHALSSQG